MDQRKLEQSKVKYRNTLKGLDQNVRLVKVVNLVWEKLMVKTHQTQLVTSGQLRRTQSGAKNTLGIYRREGIEKLQPTTSQSDTSIPHMILELPRMSHTSDWNETGPSHSLTPKSMIVAIRV